MAKDVGTLLHDAYDSEETNDMGAALARSTWDCKDGTTVELVVSNPARPLTDGEFRVYQAFSRTIGKLLYPDGESSGG